MVAREIKEKRDASYKPIKWFIPVLSASVQILHYPTLLHESSCERNGHAVVYEMPKNSGAANYKSSEASCPFDIAREELPLGKGKCERKAANTTREGGWRARTRL